MEINLDKMMEDHSSKMSGEEIHEEVLQAGDIVNIDGRFYILEGE